MIAIGSDHGGVTLKSFIVKHLKEKGLDICDVGIHDTRAVDYPDIARDVANQVLSGKCDKGILICGTGIGIGIAANKIKGIRAALCTNSFMARLSREHNDANILTLGERILGKELAIDIVDTWLNTGFEGERHIGRINKISELENITNRSE
jgi:ribose 5-phosphate isomerase B